MTSPATTVELQIAKITQAFQDAMYISSEQAQNIPAYLVNTEAKFRSVAYEGIAMRAAMRDFSKRSSGEWPSFLHSSHHVYQSHICIGMGWAIAKQKLPEWNFSSDVTSLMLFRIADGHGFYDGMFKMSQTLQAVARPSAIQHDYYKAYDQGIGRSLWYSCKGNVACVQQQIDGFAMSRHADLWRGVGLACSFVGGFTTPALHGLFESASQHRVQLGVGAAIVTRARIQTNTLTDDLDQACRIWCGLSAQQVESITDGASTQNGQDYRSWLLQIERGIEGKSSLSANALR